ncbi:hypothetical protein F0562_000942 [Nyssa sinensis]|uniref:Uncharacterized protein n=1 Tax=Nyssa sinensis TaxID=561372 RepID=A0A5J5C1W1_9ASTE|nr:hypothetical protein F0562_000942 [Nyssa sinensis]
MSGDSAGAVVGGGRGWGTGFVVLWVWVMMDMMRRWLAMMGLVSVMELRPGVGVEAAMLMEDGGAAVVMEDMVVTVGSDGMRDDGVPGLKLYGRQLWRCGGAMKDGCGWSGSVAVMDDGGDDRDGRF